MNSKPRISPRLTPFDWFLETLALCALLAGISMTVEGFPKIPEQISRYIGITGNPVGYYDRSLTLIFPVFNLLLYSLISWVNHRPWLYNFPIEITAQNAIHFYLLATRWVRLVKLIFVVALAYTNYLVIASVLRFKDFPQLYLIILGSALLLSAIVMHVLRIRQIRQKRKTAKST